MDIPQKKLFIEMKQFVFSKKGLIGIVLVILLIFITFVYLKEYRLNYCQTKFPTAKTRESARIKCIDEPLYKFIFR